jgi:uncharacterized membrane protein
MMDWYGGGTASWVAMTVMMVAFTGVAIALVVWLVRSIGGGQHNEQAALAAPHAPETWPDDASALLKRRYANGEIERAEYEQKLKDIAS